MNMLTAALAREAIGSKSNPPRTVHRLSVRMESKNVEERLKVLEERTDEWHATLRVRIVGATALSERGVELASGTREYCGSLRSKRLNFH